MSCQSGVYQWTEVVTKHLGDHQEVGEAQGRGESCG